MPHPTPNQMGKDKESTRWTSADEAVLVETLVKEKAKGMWGDNNPKPAAWTACEAALAGSEKVSGGGPKVVAAITGKSQWQRVYIGLNSPDLWLTKANTAQARVRYCQRALWTIWFWLG
jgi:hypothetical protein